MPIIQNFSVPAGDSVQVSFVVQPDPDGDEDISLHNATVNWRVYPALQGVRVAGADPLIAKVSPTNIQIIESPKMFIASIDRADTLAMLGNYYHEATVTSPGGEIVTVTIGTMNVAPTENRFP
jgi:hypothetical protein